MASTSRRRTSRSARANESLAASDGGPSPVAQDRLGSLGDQEPLAVPVPPTGLSRTLSAVHQVDMPTTYRKHALYIALHIDHEHHHSLDHGVSRPRRQHLEALAHEVEQAKAVLGVGSTGDAIFRLKRDGHHVLANRLRTITRRRNRAVHPKPAIDCHIFAEISSAYSMHRCEDLAGTSSTASISDSSTDSTRTLTGSTVGSGTAVYAPPVCFDLFADDSAESCTPVTNTGRELADGALSHLEAKLSCIEAKLDNAIDSLENLKHLVDTIARPVFRHRAAEQAPPTAGRGFAGEDPRVVVLLEQIAFFEEKIVLMGEMEKAEAHSERNAAPAEEATPAEEAKAEEHVPAVEEHAAVQQAKDTASQAAEAKQQFLPPCYAPSTVGPSDGLPCTRTQSPLVGDTQPGFSTFEPPGHREVTTAE